MTCHDARELFSDWTDEALTAEDRARVAAHLAECADCRKELERFRATVALLNRMERPRAPVGFVDRVLAARQPAPWYRRLFRRLFLPLSVKLPAEAAALLLVAVLAVYVFQRTPEFQQMAGQKAVPQMARPEPPAAPTSPPAPARREAARSALSDRPSTRQLDAKGKTPVASEVARSSVADEASKAAPQAPALPPSSPAQPTGELKKEGETQRFAAPGPASAPRPVPAEDAGKPAPASPPAAPGTVPVPGIERRGEVSGQEAGGARTPAPALQPGAAPPTEGRADSERDKLLRSPAPAQRSAVRVLPSADIVGRLAVRDRDAAERALGEALQGAGGVVISRREEAGATVVEVAVPKAAYPEFSQALARIGAWRPDVEPSDLPPHVRVTLRLIQ
jgi:hypothetical protein